MSVSRNLLLPLAALAMLACVLLTYPLLGLWQGYFLGMPRVFLYLFGVWALLIAGAGCLVVWRGRV